MRLLLVAALITTPQLAYAECPDLTPLNQGQEAPCDGVHVKSSAVAKIIVDLSSAKAQCDLRVQEQKEKSDTACAGALAKKDSEILTLKNIHSMKEEARKSQINFLVSELDKSKRSSWYFVAGTVAGIAVTMASAWTLNQIK